MNGEECDVFVSLLLFDFHFLCTLGPFFLITCKDSLLRRDALRVRVARGRGRESMCHVSQPLLRRHADSDSHLVVVP